MSAAAVTRRVQRLLLVGLAFLLAWQVAALAGTSRHVQVLLGLHGFVSHVAFVKAYSLVPSYFARELAVPRAPAVQLPLSSLGVVGLAAAGLGAPPIVGTARARGRLAGVLTFVGALAWTVRDNPTVAAGAGPAAAHLLAAGAATLLVLPGRLVVLAGAVGYAHLTAGLLRQNRR